MAAKPHLKTIVSGVLTLLALLPHVVSAASLQFAPASGDYDQNENFTVSILVDAEKPINAVGGTVTFPTEYLEVIAVSTTNSILNLWVQNPSFSNRGALGNIRFEGIVLNPGYSGSRGRIVDVVFRVKKVGSAGLTFSESSVLANDGKGTNILSSVGLATFVFTKPSSSTLTPKETRAGSTLEEKIEDIRNSIKNITASSQQTPVIVVQTPEPPEGIFKFWGILPDWVKVSVLISVGIATLILLFVLISLGIIILIWLLGHARHDGMRIARLITHGLVDALRSFFAFAKMAEKEMEGDVAYSAHELWKEFQDARKAPLFKTLFVGYWSAVGRSIRRFFTKNENSISQASANTIEMAHLQRTQEGETNST